MAGSPNNETPNSGEGKDFKEFIEKLNKEGRVELDSFNTEILRKYGTLNLAVTQGKDAVRIRSGGFEIVLKDNTVEVYREKQNVGPIHVYVSGCLVKNFEELLSRLLMEYNYNVDNKWVTVKLPRSDRRVRQLQSWILALIHGFNKPLHDSPLAC